MVTRQAARSSGLDKKKDNQEITGYLKVNRTSQQKQMYSTLGTPGISHRAHRKNGTLCKPTHKALKPTRAGLELKV